MVNFARIEVSRNFALNKRAANHRPCPHRASAHTSLLLIQLQREKGWNFNYFFAGIDNLRIWFCVKIGRTASWISVWVTLQYARASSVADPRAALPQWHNVRIIHGEKMVTTQLRLPPSPFYSSSAKKRNAESTYRGFQRKRQEFEQQVARLVRQVKLGQINRMILLWLNSSHFLTGNWKQLQRIPLGSERL